MIRVLFLSLFLIACAKQELSPEPKAVKEQVKEEPQKLEKKEEPKQEKKIVKKIKIKHTPKVKKYCEKISKKFLYWGWGHSRCKNYKWEHVRDSFLGDPLIWTVFGDEKKALKQKYDVTMVLCGVHGDEITPVKFCFDIIKYLSEQNEESFEKRLVFVAPIVTPDSFFKKRPTRTNARGVDVNRNFPTKDWNKLARKIWKERYRLDKRRNPGLRPMSEHEVIFQVNLIKRYKPTRIISVHAPLTLIDYDGPEEGGNAKELLIQMSEDAKGYKIKNYPFFPGSLGNYAGNERSIPTYTLELPSSDNRKHKEYWKRFKSAIHSAIFMDFSAQ